MHIILCAQNARRRQLFTALDCAENAESKRAKLAVKYLGRICKNHKLFARNVEERKRTKSNSISAQLIIQDDKLKIHFKIRRGGRTNARIRQFRRPIDSN